MARPLRIQFPGGVYHVISRGNARQAIFDDDADRQRFLRALNLAASTLGWRLFAYCLMTNHYHLCVETPGPTLARGMRDVNGTYAQGFNRRHGRVGHLFQSRYAAIVVEKDSHLLELARYIVLNPVRAGLCASAGDWPWSSYRVTLGQTARWIAVSSEVILRQFSPNLREARAGYERFVAAGTPASTPSRQSPSVVVAGSESFGLALASHIQGPTVEVPREQRRLRSLREFEQEASSRDEAIRRAHESGSYSYVEIGRHFGLHYSTVSKICRGIAIKARRRYFPILGTEPMPTVDLTPNVNSRPDPKRRPDPQRQFKT
jgi:REP element-mobilizing transposase RayT